MLNDTGIGDCGSIISTLLDKTKCQCADACSKSSDCVAARMKTNGICQLCRGYFVPVKFPGYVVMAKNVNNKQAYILDDPVVEELVQDEPELQEFLFPDYIADGVVPFTA